MLMMAGLMFGVAAGVFGREPATPPPAAEPSPAEWAETREKTFGIVWDTVNEAYFDPTFGGVDWAAVREKYRTRLAEAGDKPALRKLLTAMLGELHRTHFSILPREMAVFTPGERTRIGTTGVKVVAVGDDVAVSEVRASSAGQRADLRPGDVILDIDGWKLEPISAYLKSAGIPPARSGLYLTQLATGRLQGAVGSTVKLDVRGVDGAERKAEMVVEAQEGDWSEPMGDYPSVPVECAYSMDADGLVSLRFNVFARQVMKGVRAALRFVPADGGLVIDLRGNPGGISVMASGISGWLSDRTYLMATMHLRQGHIGYTVNPQDNAFLGPVAVLIDCGSASTSEIMAAGLQEAGRARIFGEPSPGAALPSTFKSLPTGDLFQYAVGDFQTPHGLLIEGRGVQPDEVVRRTCADLAAGEDPALAAARRWIARERHKPAPVEKP